MNMKTPVSALQELIAARNLPLPSYLEEQLKNGQFKCTVYAAGVTAVGFSSTKKGAKHESARSALQKLKPFHKPQTVPGVSQNFVGELNEFATKKNLGYPEYKPIKNDDGFIVSCDYLNFQTFGSSANKKEAKQESARNMLDMVQHSNNNTNNAASKMPAMKTTDDQDELASQISQLSFGCIESEDDNYSQVSTFEPKHLDEVELLRSKLERYGICYTVREIRAKPFALLTLVIGGTSNTFIEKGWTKEDALKKVLRKILMLHESGCLLNNDLI